MAYQCLVSFSEAVRNTDAEAAEEQQEAEGKVVVEEVQEEMDLMLFDPDSFEPRCVRPPGTQSQVTLAHTKELGWYV